MSSQTALLEKRTNDTAVERYCQIIDDLVATASRELPARKPEFEAIGGRFTAMIGDLPTGCAGSVIDAQVQAFIEALGGEGGAICRTGMLWALGELGFGPRLTFAEVKADTDGEPPKAVAAGTTMHRRSA